jgi:hypothetical protein
VDLALLLIKFAISVVSNIYHHIFPFICEYNKITAQFKTGRIPDGCNKDRWRNTVLYDTKDVVNAKDAKTEIINMTRQLIKETLEHGCK